MPKNPTQSGAPRLPWADFPPVLRNANIGTLKLAPEYLAAKAGDTAAALDMADRLITVEFVEAVHGMGSGYPHPTLLPVLAEESAGRNKIPEMFAYTLANRLGWDVHENVVQITRAYRTDSGADHRLVIHPEFAGNIDLQAGYILIDDTLTMGGTLADLRGFILHAGGQVVGAAVAVAHEGALNLPIHPQMMENIHRKHGNQESEDFAHEQWGYGIECLTQGEAGHLYKAVSLDALRDRFSAARNAHLRRMGESRIETPLSKRPGIDGSEKNRVTASKNLSSQTNFQGLDAIARPGLSVFPDHTTFPTKEDTKMAFGAHLRPAQPDQAPIESQVAQQGINTEDTENDIPGQPEWLDDQPGPSSENLLSQDPASTEAPAEAAKATEATDANIESTNDAAGVIEPEVERLAHMDAFQAVLQDVIELRELQGDQSAHERVPLVAKALLDYRDAGMPLADLSTQVIDKSYFKVPATESGPSVADDGQDRWTMTPENQPAEKAANLETLTMVHDHLEQSGIDLGLVAEQFQSLMEQADQQLQDEHHGPELTETGMENLPNLVDEPIFAPETFAGDRGLRVLTDVEYQEILQEAAKKLNPDDEEDEEDEDDPHLSTREIADNMALLALHMRQARTRKEMNRYARASTPVPAPQPLAVDSKPSAKDQQSTRGAASRPSLPLPRLPSLHLPHINGMDYESFIRGRRVGQMSAARDALLKMDRLSDLREKASDPKTREQIDLQMGRQAKRLAEQGGRAFDEKGLDLLMRGGADPRLITDTMNKMEQWKNLFGTEDDLHGNTGDALRQALEKLAQAIQRIVDRVVGRFAGKSETLAGGNSLAKDSVRTAPTLD